MDPLLLVSLTKYLDDVGLRNLPRLKSSQGERTTPTSHPKPPTKPLQQRLQPTLNQRQEKIVIVNTGLSKSVNTLQKVRPESSQSPQGYRQPAHPSPIRYPQVQQNFGQLQQGITQFCQGFEQSLQEFRQSPQEIKQFSHGSGHSSPVARQFSQAIEQSPQNCRKLFQGPGQLSQGYRQPPQGFGQAPAQNFGQSPDGYPQLSSLGYRHELASPSTNRHPSARASHPGYRQAVQKNAPAPAEPSWKRPTSNDNTLIISHRSHRGRFLRQTNVLLGALLGFVGLLYFFLI